MAEQPSRRLAYGAALLQTGVSAGTYLVAKHALTELVFYEVAAFRFVGAALVYALLLAVLRAPLIPPPAARRRAVLLGLIGLPLNQGCFLAGLWLSSAAHAAIFYALTPACVLVAERIFLGRRLAARNVVGIGIALAGVLFVLLGRGLDLQRGALAGDLLLLAAVFSWAAYTILMRPLAQKSGAFVTTGWAVMSGALMTLPLPIFAFRDPTRFAHVSLGAWGGIAYLVLLTSVVAYWLWAFALRGLESVRVAVFTNLQPVATAALAAVFLHEAVTLPTVVGGLLVIAGVWLSQRPDTAHVPPRARR